MGAATALPRVTVFPTCADLHGTEQRQEFYTRSTPQLPSSVDAPKETYRQRIAIETTYRQLGQARLRTCTQDPRRRFLDVAIALILRNVWVWLHWEILSRPRQGRRRIDLNQLPFRAMLLWLQHLAEAELGVCDAVQAQRLVITQIGTKCYAD
jgi:hypothetical protein